MAIVHHGEAFPLYWSFLTKKGNSNTGERVALLEQFITTFGTARIACLAAAREFVGQQWFKYLRQQKILFRIRVCQNFQVAAKKGSIPVLAIFQHLVVGESLALPLHCDCWAALL